MKVCILKLKYQHEASKMIYTYNYKDYCYIPIHLNSLFSSRTGFKESMNVSRELFKEVATVINDVCNKTILFDFAEVLIVEQRGFVWLTDILKNNSCIITNTNKLINDRIIRECNIDNIINKDCFWYSNNLDYNSIEALKETNKISSNILRHFYQQEKNAPVKDVFIDSSNVIASKYLDVKILFYKPDLNNLSIYQICRAIYNTHLNKFDKILSGSMNGAALAGQIGQILDKDILLIMNLGPYLSLRDKEIIKKIKKGTRFLFVGDMVCLGREVTSAKLIVNLKDAEWIGGAAIFKYLEPNNNKSISGVIDIYDDDDDDENLNYSLKIKKLK